MENLAHSAIADAIKGDPSDGNWVVWITPSDAANRALNGLEVAGFKVVRDADHLGAVEALSRASVRRDYHGNPTTTHGWVQVSFRPEDWATLNSLRERYRARKAAGAPII